MREMCCRMRMSSIIVYNQGKGFSYSITPQYANQIHIKTQHESSSWQVITQSLTPVRPSQACWPWISAASFTFDLWPWLMPLLPVQVPYFKEPTLVFHCVCILFYDNTSYDVLLRSIKAWNAYISHNNHLNPGSETQAWQVVELCGMYTDQMMIKCSPAKGCNHIS